MEPNDFFSPVSRELHIVESGLDKHINPALPVLEQASVHLLKAGGKRLRPAFALLAARIFRNDLTDIIPMATALEMIHMATLVHDDVIDNSQTRRGVETVKEQWGNRISINAGNYIFARALAMVARYERSDVVNILAEASMKIVEGEIIQMMSAYNAGVGLKNYLRRIERKTALLISVSCQLGALLARAQAEQVTALKKYGYYLGMAFQVTDDILDYVADESVLGKPTGSDIRQGIITLPAIYALRCSPDRDVFSRLISTPDQCTYHAEEIIEWVLESQGVDYAYHAARCYAWKAQRQLRHLPDTDVTRALHEMADFISAREY